MGRKLRFEIGIVVLITAFILTGCFLSEETYQLSGRIVREDGPGINRVAVNIDGHEETPETDNFGYWTATDVSGEVTLTPVLEGLRFEPRTKNISEARSDITFTGTITGLVLHEWSIDDDEPLYRGKIRNITDATTFKRIRIIFTIYDDDDKDNILGTAEDHSLAVDGLEPGETVEFAATAHDLNTDQLSFFDYEIRAAVQ